MPKKPLDDKLKGLRACNEARKWATSYPTLAEAWGACQRGDWMLWYAGREQICSREQLVLAACACARLALPYVPTGEERPRAAIETAEAWARGDGTTIEQVRAAYAAAFAAYAAAAFAAAFAAAAFAAYAADAASAAADAASAAAYAADAAAASLRESADIVRRQAEDGGWRLVEEAP